MPPANDVPPTTAAAMTYSSSLWPTSRVDPLSRAEEMAAAIAHRTPIRMKVFMIVQRVLMPASSAASGLPP